MKLFNLLSLFLVSYTINAQSITFNKRLVFGQYSAILSSLETTDSCYYATGVVAYTPNGAGATVFAKFDTLGNLIDTTFFYDIEAWNPFLITTLQGNLSVAGYKYDSTIMKTGFLNFSESGVLLDSSFYTNPYTVGDFIRPDDMQMTSDSGYIFANGVNNPIEAADISILRIDKNDSIIWHITRGVVNMVESVPCIYQENDGYVIGYQIDNIDAVSMNFTIRSKLEKIDQNGNTVWTYQSPSNQQVYGVNDLIKSKDGGWVAASSWGHEYVSGSNHYATGEAYVYKLDSARNFLWGTKFSSDSYIPGEYFSRILELEDSSLVAFGIVERLYPQPNPTYFIIHGRVVKLSPQGDSLWSREYQYLNTADAQHYIYDAARTYDSGFLVCGESRGNGSGAIQQGWLLKLDEHGCLVPGCYLALGELPSSALEDFRLSLYPNPTTDYLNVFYQSERVGTELTFSVVDMQGKVLQNYTTMDESDKTYIVPVYDLVAGVYVLEVRRDGKLVKSEKFVKQ